MDEKEVNKMEEKKVISIEDRIPRLKEERKKKANRQLIFYLSIFFLLISFIVYLQSPYSKVKEIKVAGNDILNDEEVIEWSSVTTDTNIWTLEYRSMKNEIANHPLIQSVEMKRKLPQTIHITVKEHDIVGYVQENNKFYPVLKDGTVKLNYEMNRRGDQPHLINFKEEEYLEKIATELSEIPDHIVELISEVVWEPTKKNKNNITLYMNDGFIVHATLRDFSNKMKNYPSIIAQLDPKEKGIVHMGVGIYFEKAKKK